MKVILAPDSFKDSLRATEVGSAMEEGVKQFESNSECVFIPASDGGEGFLTAIQRKVPTLEVVTVDAFDPLHRPRFAKYLLQKENKTAYIELASASGLELLRTGERNPVHTSTYGTGILIQDAIEKGATQLYIGIGGSATNDGAMGIAKALGYRFMDDRGIELKAAGLNLKSIRKIIPPKEPPNIKIFAINDVNNVLFGKQGAAYTYAGQKGASKTEIELLDDGLRNLDQIVQTDLGKFESTTPGAGAAGGTAYGLKVFFDANFINGTNFLLDLVDFDTLISKGDIDAIFTGEGKIDHQTIYGKFVYSLAQRARQHGIPVIAICGKLDLDQEGVEALGLKAAYEIADETKDSSYSYQFAYRLIKEQTTQALQDLFNSPQGR